MSRNFIAIVLAAAPLCSFAQVAPIVLTVPVELKSLSDGLLLRCRTGTGPNALGRESTAKVQVDNVHGNFSGNVTVPMNFSKASDTYYRCELVTQLMDGRVVPVGPAMAKPGAPLTAIVAGPIKK